MISSNDFRPGVHIELDGELYTVVESAHVKIGRGSAYVRAKVRNVRTGSIVERKFNAGERVPHAYLETKKMQYLYSDGELYHFMDNENYEQIALPEKIVGGGTRFLKENMNVDIVFYEGAALEVELPNSVELAIVDTPPGIRGDTATGGSKLAKLETGAQVQVPLFVEKGERIRVDTRSGQYLERVR